MKRHGVYKLDYPKTVWKKCIDGCADSVLVELELPAGATIVEPSPCLLDYGFKCRCDKAIVKKIFSIDEHYGAYYNGTKLFAHSVSFLLVKKTDETKAFSLYGGMYSASNGVTSKIPTAVYEVGKTVTSKYALNTSVNKACGSGIHYFNTMREAVLLDSYSNRVVYDFGDNGIFCDIRYDD